MEGERRETRQRSEGAEIRKRQRSAKKSPPADDVSGLTMRHLMLC